MNFQKCIIDLFKVSCSVITAFMVGFWIYKFQKNDDIAQIEYNTIKTSADAEYPEMAHDEPSS